MNPEERNLLYVAYKNLIGLRRNTYHDLTHALKQDDKNQDLLDLQNTITKELNNLSDEFLNLIEKTILPTCQDNDNLIYYHKLIGDLNRYKSEYNLNET